MLSKLKKLYYNFNPSLLKPIYLVPIQYRLGGKKFIETLNFISQSEKWSFEKLRKYQAYMLNKLLKYTIKKIPFYRGIKLSGKPFKDLAKFKSFLD